MEQQVAVYDENNVSVGMTFRRRAKQLVGKQRALWLDERHTAIRLIPELEGEVALEKGFSDQSNSGYKTTEGAETSALYDKDCLRCLAKKRVKEKKDLIRSMAIYFAGSIFLIVLYSASYYDVFQEGLCLGALYTWLLFSLYRVGTYTYNRVKGMNFLKRPYRQDPVEVEYNKLAMMEPGKIVMEYKRL